MTVEVALRMLSYKNRTCLPQFDKRRNKFTTTFSDIDPWWMKIMSSGIKKWRLEKITENYLEDPKRKKGKIEHFDYLANISMQRGLSIYPRVSGRWYKISPVCVCVSVCLSVCQRSHSWTIWNTNLKFGMNIALWIYNGWVRRSRSKVKVAILKNVIFRLFYGVTCIDCTDQFCNDIWRHVTSRCDVRCRHGLMSWH